MESCSSVSVRVPATSANLGPGFDTLGVALTLYNRFSFQAAEQDEITVTGESAEELAAAPQSLTLKAAACLAEKVGKPLPPLCLHIENTIPLQRGLGSSASAIVGGLTAANALLGHPLDRAGLLELAARMEGHPDNVTPALLGGFQAAVLADGAVYHSRLPVPADVETRLRLVVCIPEIRMGTGVSRAALTETVSHADAAFTVGRASLLVAALCAGRLDLLATGLEDRLHQPQRGRLIPGFTDALRAARGAGAYGACLSGSGSTLLAFASEEAAPAIGAALTATLTDNGLAARWLSLSVDTQGAVAEY